MDSRSRQAFIKKARDEASRETTFFQLFDYLIDGIVPIAAAGAFGVLLSGLLLSLLGAEISFRSISANSLGFAAIVAGVVVILLLPGALMLSFLPLHLSRSGIRFSVTQSYWENISDFRIRKLPIPCLVLEGDVLQGMTVFYSTACRSAFREAVKQYAGSDHPLIGKLATLPPRHKQPAHLAAVLFLVLVVCGNLWTWKIGESPFGKPRAQAASVAAG